MAISCSGKKMSKKIHGMACAKQVSLKRIQNISWNGLVNAIKFFFSKKVAFIEFELENISLNMQSTNDCTLLHCNFASKDFQKKTVNHCSKIITHKTT